MTGTVFRTMLVVFVLAGVVGIGFPARAEKRVALVVGIDTYQRLPDLPNPGNDARTVAAALEGLGFTLIGGKAQIDPDRATLLGLLSRLGEQSPGALAVTYVGWWTSPRSWGRWRSTEAAATARSRPCGQALRDEVSMSCSPTALPIHSFAPSFPLATADKEPT